MVVRLFKLLPIDIADMVKKTNSKQYDS